jgi:hypothetical protein
MMMEWDELIFPYIYIYIYIYIYGKLSAEQISQHSQLNHAASARLQVVATRVKSQTFAHNGNLKQEQTAATTQRDLPAAQTAYEMH